MDKNTFIKLHTNPALIQSEHIVALEEVIKNFPYCQSAYILLAKQAADTGSLLANQKIKRAATYCFDRKRLKDLLNNNPQKEASETSAEPIKNYTSQRVNLDVNQEEIPKPLQQDALLHYENKKDTLVDELRRNLEQLHINKLKAAGEKIPEELEKVELPKTKKEEIKPQTLEGVILPNEKLKADFPSITFNSFVPFGSSSYRQEQHLDKQDQTLLLDYLGYLDEKRSAFRKNKKKEEVIINKFIKEDPKIPKLDINNLPDNSIDLSKQSSSVVKEPVSENFAKILALQNKFQKAISIYEQLILKFPEKRAYFEAQIEKLKNRI